VKQQDKVVIKKIILTSFKEKYTNHDDAFHGTKFDSLYSIAKNGLGFPGDYVDGKKI
jgi:hypothetical protein